MAATAESKEVARAKNQISKAKREAGMGNAKATEP
jgi:hypothetical protein